MRCQEGSSACRENEDKDMSEDRDVQAIYNQYLQLGNAALQLPEFEKTVTDCSLIPNYLGGY